MLTTCYIHVNNMLHTCQHLTCFLFDPLREFCPILLIALHVLQMCMKVILWITSGHPLCLRWHYQHFPPSRCHLGNGINCPELTVFAGFIRNEIFEYTGFNQVTTV